MDLLSQVDDGGDEDICTNKHENEREPKEVCVVSLSNAGAQPEAVVIKEHHAVVTHVAVSRAKRPEDQTSLTKLELLHCLLNLVRLAAAYHQVGDSLLFHLDVCVVLCNFVFVIACKELAWDNPRIFSPCQKEEHSGHKLQA